MLAPGQGQSVATLWEAVVLEDGRPANNVFNSRAVFFALRDDGFQEYVSGGRLFEMTLEYAENPTFKSYSEWETLDTTRVDVFDAARYDQKICAGTVSFSDLSLAQNQEPNRKINVLESCLDNGKNSNISALNRMFNGYGIGNAGKDFNGIGNIISATPITGVVGGINRATWAFFRNRQNSGAMTLTAYDNLRGAMTLTANQCSLGGVTDFPPYAVTDRTVFGAYESLLIPIERIQKNDGQAGKGDIGFLNSGLRFKGSTLFYDEDAIAAELRFMNAKYLKLMCLKGYFMKMLDAVEPSNQLSRVYRVETFGNLGTNGSRYLGVVTAIS